MDLMRTDRSRHALTQHYRTSAILSSVLSTNSCGRLTSRSLTRFDLNHTWTSWEYFRMFLLDAAFRSTITVHLEGLPPHILHDY
jgi:hypothetical protein